MSVWGEEKDWMLRTAYKTGLDDCTDNFCIAAVFTNTVSCFYVNYTRTGCSAACII